MRGLILSVAVALGSLAGAVPDSAREMYRSTEYRLALSELQAETSQDPQVLLLAGQAAFGLREFKKASDYLEKSVSLDPDNSIAHHWLGKAYGRRAETASFLSAPGLASKCRREFEKAVALGGAGNTEAMADLLEYYLEAPGFLGGGREKAAELAKRIAAADAAEGEFALARVAEDAKNVPEAERHWRRAAELESAKPERLVDLARFLARQGRIPESDRYLEQAFRMAPEKPALWFWRAEILIESKRNSADARRLLERYIASRSITPDDPPRQDARQLLGKLK